MVNHYNLVTHLTSPNIHDRTRYLNDFASGLGWHPSDRIMFGMDSKIATAHLLVEHGLQNTAVISFLKYPKRYPDLTFQERIELLNISYNNLVDWHIHVQNDQVTFVFNRSEPARVVETRRISHDNYDSLRSEAFEQIIGRQPNPNIQALDDALISTISFWKRTLSAELGYSISNSSLSALFNAIIFARAVEDQHKRNKHGVGTDSQELLNAFSKSNNLIEAIKNAIYEFTDSAIPDYLINEAGLEVFSQLHNSSVESLFRDFYLNRYATSYRYDFSLMSKHALSRIYEHYVSILRIDDSPQLSLFPQLPREELDKAYGSFYTPQYIARFFARYLRNQMSPQSFRQLKAIDPACGSGIFLRTLLELQCDPVQPEVTTPLIMRAFQRAYGIDVDDNARKATELSLALLHLVLTNQLPKTLKIESSEAIEYFSNHEELHQAFDTVIANPPFISFDNQSDEMRELVANFMGEYGHGRTDIYLAFLRMSIDLLKPGGFGCFVLPHSFLLGENAARIRSLISETCWIHCIADLSAIRVFGDTGAYIILLIFQRHPSYAISSPKATIVKCQEFVGKALQNAVEGKIDENPYYSIYSVQQSAFKTSDWLILPPSEAIVKKKMSLMPILSDFMQSRQGFVSGADGVFILDAHMIHKDEKDIFVEYLPDREMRAYRTPSSTSKYFFYPYLDGKKISAEEMQLAFPKTWNYLKDHKQKLQKRGSLKKYNREWWEPMWPRLPSNMLRPKIITPHLVIAPKFSLDSEGVFAVSRSPLLYLKTAVFGLKEENSQEEDMDTSALELDYLKFFLAILNSSVCFWYITTNSHRYQRGYTMLEPKTLNQTFVPNPLEIDTTQLQTLISKVDLLLDSNNKKIMATQREVDSLVADLYQLSSRERTFIGL